MGNRIKETRIKLGMTQEELAEKSNTCRATICLIENDEEHNPSMKTLVSIAKALGTSVEDIFFSASD